MRERLADRQRRRRQSSEGQTHHDTSAGDVPEARLIGATKIASSVFVRVCVCGMHATIYMTIILKYGYGAVANIPRLLNVCMGVLVSR